MVYYFNKKNYGLFLSKIQKEQGLEKDDVAQMGSVSSVAVSTSSSHLAWKMGL